MSFLSRMEKGIEIGSRFAAIEPAEHMRAHPDIWTVERVYEGPDGRSHAIVVSNLDSTRRKTFSVATLIDAKLYRQV
jgi:hypothetical protein